MSPGEPFIAVDWGTTNRRSYLVRNGVAIAVERDDHGAATVRDFPGEIAAMRQRLGELPMLLAGMVGSSVGWRETPYVPAPADLETIARNLLNIDDRTAIVPGISAIEGLRGDVMRGEEVQILGAIVTGALPADAFVAQPGTHCKWVDVAGGRIARFTTTMTGELFSLLSRQSLLARQLGGAVSAGAAFAAGVREGTRCDLAASLFSVRASGVLGLRSDADAASFTSGVLIGADVAARLAECRRDLVFVLSDGDLAGLYAAAIAQQGVRVMEIQSEPAFIAGICEIGKLSG